MSGGITFRDAINYNKKIVLEYLALKGGWAATDEILYRCRQKNIISITDVRKALKELEKEEKVKCKIVGLNSKQWIKL